jgi:hypothetical protein
VVEDEVNVRLLALSTQQSTFLAHLEELLGFHLLAALSPFPIRAVVAEDVIQRGTRVESVLSYWKFEADLTVVVQHELIEINDAVVVEIRSLKFAVYIALYLLCCLQQSFISKAVEVSYRKWLQG